MDGESRRDRPSFTRSRARFYDSLARMAGEEFCHSRVLPRVKTKKREKKKSNRAHTNAVDARRRHVCRTTTRDRRCITAEAAKARVVIP